MGELHVDATGQYDQEQLTALWTQHAEEYRQWLDGNCGLNNSALRAFPGATKVSCEEARLLLERRQVLLQWLDPKLSKVKRAALERSHPVQVAHFKKVQEMQVHAEHVRHYASAVRCCLNTMCRLCKGAPRVTQWYEEGPALKPVPPALHDECRPGHYLDPESSLARYASVNYQLKPDELLAPSDIAHKIYAREMGDSLAHFPEAKIAAAVKEINDSRIDAVALRKHFTKLRFIRLRVLEGRRKGAETRKKNAASRAAPTTAAQKVAEKAAAEKAATEAVVADAAMAAEAEAAESAAAEAAETEAGDEADAEEEAEGGASGGEAGGGSVGPVPVRAPAAQPRFPCLEVGAEMEVQGCGEACNFLCTTCEWELCTIDVDHGHLCDVRISSEGVICKGVARRHLRSKAKAVGKRAASVAQEPPPEKAPRAME